MKGGKLHLLQAMLDFFEDQDYVRHRGHYYGSIIVTLPNVSDHDFKNIEDNDVALYLDYLRQDLIQYAENNYEKWGGLNLRSIFLGGRIQDRRSVRMLTSE